MTTNDKISVGVFGALTVACLLAIPFNGWYLLFAAMCAIMVWAIISEARKDEKQNQNK